MLVEVLSYVQHPDLYFYGVAGIWERWFYQFWEINLDQTDSEVCGIIVVCSHVLPNSLGRGRK